MTIELRKDVAMLLKNKHSITGVIKYLLNKNIVPNEIIKELTKRHYDVDYIKRILWMNFHIKTRWCIQIIVRRYKKYALSWSDILNFSNSKTTQYIV